MINADLYWSMHIRLASRYNSVLNTKQLQKQLEEEE